MNYQMSKAHEKALTDAENTFKYGDSHPGIVTWRREAFEAYGFYDGTRQWPAAVLADLRARGQDPVIVNKIKPLVNYLSGVEIQTRIRIAFRADSDKEEEETLAKAITHKIYRDQERLNIPHWDSYKFRDSLISGIGWSNIFNEEGNSEYELVNPFNIIYDADDLTPELTKSSFIVRLRWVNLEQAEMHWPSKSKFFKSMFGGRSNIRNTSDMSNEIYCRLNGYQGIYSIGSGSFGSKILIIEVQNRRSKKCYYGFDYQGHYFETFSEEEAEQLSPKSKDIQEKYALQIMRTVFTNNCLLEYAPLNPNIPNLKDFTYVPTLWSRRFEDGVPEGWISVMKDLQRESNYRRAKLISDLSSVRVFVDPEAMDGVDAEQMAENFRRNASINFVSKPKENIIIDENSKLSGPQFQMLQHTDQELQQVSGIYDDALGKQTNATSGVAVKERQINSVRNQIFAFDNFKHMKKRAGEMFLALLQGSGQEFLESKYLDEDEKQSIILNMSRNINGKKVMFNDIRTLPLSLYVEEVSDFSSSADERRAVMENILANQRADLILQSPAIMRLMQVRDYKQIAKEMQQIAQQNNPKMAGGDGGINGVPEEGNILEPTQDII